MGDTDGLKMEKRDEEIFSFLDQFGRAGQLRKRLISLLISVGDMYADLKTSGEETEEVVGLAKKIELLLGEFAVSQSMANRMFIGLEPRVRKAFLEEIPELMDIFGWHDEFDEGRDFREES